MAKAKRTCKKTLIRIGRKTFYGRRGGSKKCGQHGFKKLTPARKAWRAVFKAATRKCSKHKKVNKTRAKCMSNAIAALR